MARDPLHVKSLEAAYSAFRSAGNNEHVMLAALGVKGAAMHDKATFDAVREKYEKPRVDNFKDAFKACWRGSRDWRKFDLETLRECANGELSGLQLPEKIEAAMMQEEISDRDESVAQHEDGEELPPLEMKTTAPFQRTRRKLSSTRDALRKRYKNVKRMYHALGEALRRSGEKTKRRAS